MKSENEAARPHIGAQGIPVGPNGHPWAGPSDNGHMPFRGHRTVAELWADEQRLSIARGGRR